MIPATDLLPPDLQASDYERLCLQKLEAEEVAALGRFGRNRTFADGEHLFRTGDRDLSVFIVLRGEAQVYFTRGGKEHELVVVGEGNFIGDVSMLTRMAAVASVRARSTGGRGEPRKRVPTCAVGLCRHRSEDHSRFCPATAVAGING